MGLNEEQASRLKASLRHGDDAVLQTIKEIQNEHKKVLKQQGTDTDAFIPEVGVHIQWSDILKMAFHVVDFDRNNTIITPTGEVKATSQTKPYGYLLVESPTLNQRIGLPIIHKDDFVLATTVFDEPQLMDLVNGGDIELLVTYAPKNEKNGYATSPQHVLHYVLVPSGTLEMYYADTPEGNRRMSRPEPKLLFGDFVYDGEISVGTNAEPLV